ncbi:type VI secretion system-associated protein VasI [Shewanella nanhaiensis]|uniref:Type VI secretion system-associated protein TagO n=1 Tax=Shewanella nanhaiensis TaxID=2864872 RepID=A0ABS7E6W1_9GAMM|nr:type VI secretion system-associated protein VasI [Shewanella nanhaiensis]MBW8185422.1 type VI secretion system-associated protein TagO [Shewanella nanhaiensis]
MTAASCYASPLQLSDPKACVQIKSKLERLYCFDQAFMTPIAVDATQGSEQARVAEWVRADASEANRQGETHFLLGQQEDNPNNVWLTATAIGALPPRPVLMLSCIDEISRVELVLSEEVAEGSIYVAVNKPSSQGELWVSDNSGLVFRTGRGIPAIHLMKKMLLAQEFTLSSDNANFNDLQFDATGLKQAIKPLQKACRW